MWTIPLQFFRIRIGPIHDLRQGQFLVRVCQRPQSALAAAGHV